MWFSLLLFYPGNIFRGRSVGELDILSKNIIFQCFFKEF